MFIREGFVFWINGLNKRFRYKSMTRKKVLLIALAITVLGGFQVLHWTGEKSRAARVGKASGMIALFSGVAMGLYGLRLKR